MKVYVSVDMEGVAGVVSWAQVTPGNAEYGPAQEWMIEEANAAVEGLLAAGATEVVVNDSHGPMRNLLPHRLHPRATLISGGVKDQGMMAGLDDSFHAAVFIGYHGQGGGYGVLAHTWSGAITGVRLNDTAVGEWGLNAMIAGEYGVPVIMVSGDDCVAAEVRDGLPGPVETVVVKKALTKFAAQSLPRDEAVAAIKNGATYALQRVDRVPLYKPGTPVRLEVDFGDPLLADGAAMMPGARRLGPMTAAYSAATGLEAFRAFLTFNALAAYAK